MAIPDYQSCMLPLLKLVADGNDHSLREVVDLLAGVFQLTEAERAELLPSGGQQVFHNRIGWARSYLKKAGLLDAPRRGVFRITPRGLDVLARQPVRIDVRFLEQFPEFVQFREGSRKEGAELPALPQEESDGTPEEMLELAHQKIRSELAQELINRILLCSPRFFRVFSRRIAGKNGVWRIAQGRG